MDAAHGEARTTHRPRSRSRRGLLGGVLGGLLAASAGVRARSAVAKQGTGHGKTQDKRKHQSTYQLPPGGSSVGPIARDPEA